MNKLIAILIFILLLTSLLNSDIFGSPTLFALYACGYVTLLATIAIGIKNFKKHASIQFKIPTILFLVFASYQILNNILFQNYVLKHYYLLYTVLLFLSITIYFQCLHVNEYNKFKSNFFVYILILIYFEFAFITLQIFGILRTSNSSFLCSGSWINPNVTAMFLAMALFVMFEYSNLAKKKYKQTIISISLIVCFISLLLLNCRSAIIAAFIISLNHYKNFIQTKLLTLKKNIKTKQSFSTIIILFATILLFSSFLASKSKSTEGRLTIWKNAISLCKKAPMFGNGLGKFEHVYNNYTITINNANNEHVNTAYNDFIETTIETGIIGLLLFSVFLGSLLLYFYKNKIWNYFSLTLSIIAMQATNFLWQAIPAYILIVFILSFAITENEFKIGFTLKNKLLLQGFIGLIFAVCIYCFLAFHTLMVAHSDLKQIARTSNNIDSMQLLEPILNNHSFYYSTIANSYYNTNQYNKALPFFKMALTKSCEPTLIQNIASCFNNLQLHDSAITYLKKLEKLEPKKIYPNLAYMNTLISIGDTIAAGRKAMQIFKKGIIVNNKRVREIKKYAFEYLTSKNKSQILKLN